MTLLFQAEGWDPAPWLETLSRQAPEREIRLWPQIGNAAEIDYALVWKPPAELLAGLPALKVIFSLGAGVDHLLRLPNLPPEIPIVRVSDADLTQRMSEYVMLHVLRHHRRRRDHAALQAGRQWRELSQPAAGEVRVGVMGLGVLGRDAALKLAAMGVQVAGWSRSPKRIDGIECYAGAGELDDFLARTDILVCLLPLTPDTKGLLNRDLIRGLARDGAGKGPALINAGRGGVQVERDILAALDAGELYEATLDVFETEPLPANSPLWSHERVTITPHDAAPSTPAGICGAILKQIESFECGRALDNLVDRRRGY